VSLIEYFIICHNQDLILEMIRKGSFDVLPGRRFLFVGHADCSLLEGREEVVVCRNLPDNIERFPKLCSFTGWYAVARNGLGSSENVCLLEYDVEVDASLHEKNLAVVGEGLDLCVSYFLEPLDLRFSRSTPWLEVALSRVRRLDLDAFMKGYLGVMDVHWPCTTNMMMPAGVLNRFVNWFEPMTQVFRQDPLGSYVHERAFYVFCRMNEIAGVNLRDLVKHDCAMSHGSADLYRMFLESRGLEKIPDELIGDLENEYQKVLKTF
jgi:hypothetical protein